MTAAKRSPPAGANPARNYGLAVLACITVLIVAGIVNQEFQVARTAYVAVLFVICAGP